MIADPRAIITALVEKFDADFDNYVSAKGKYLEADARSEFIDPLQRSVTPAPRAASGNHAVAQWIIVGYIN